MFPISLSTGRHSGSSTYLCRHSIKEGYQACKIGIEYSCSGESKIVDESQILITPNYKETHNLMKHKS